MTRIRSQRCPPRAPTVTTGTILLFAREEAIFWVAGVALAIVAGLLAGRVALRARPLLVARYYVLTTASLAAGLWDWLRYGTQAGWEPAEGTR